MRASGAAAISVLTDRHFKGSLEDLRTVRAAVDLPLLRKDFIFDPYQLLSGASGRRGLYPADRGDAERSTICVRSTRRRANLVFKRWLKSITRTNCAPPSRAGAEIVGINNRDLHTFVTDIAVTERLLEDYRGAALVVSESGIDTPEDIRRLDRAGARAFLIGESLLRGGDPRRKLETLCFRARAARRIGRRLGPRWRCG